MTLRLFTVPVLLLACAAAPAAGVFKWTDAGGKVHYGDRPPAEAAAQSLTVGVLPAALEERLRKLDPAFTITRIGGNLEAAWVCGKFDVAVEGKDGPKFPAALEAAGLGRIKGHNAFDDASEHFRYYASDYDENRCGAAPPRNKMQLRTYVIRFAPDSVAVYRDSGGLK